MTSIEQDARLRTKEIYSRLGWTAWDVNSNAKSIYQIGINLDKNYKFESQIEEIEDIAHAVALENKLYMTIEGPTFVAGGIHAVYVGLSHINPELQKRFANYKISKKYSGKIGEGLEKGMKLIEEEQITGSLNTVRKLEKGCSLL